jgi:O-antigen ligase
MKKPGMINGLLFVYLTLFPLGQLTRVPLEIGGFSEIHLYLTDIFVALLVSAWLGEKLFKKKKFFLPPLAKPIFLFSFLAFLSLLYNSPLLASGEVVTAFLYLFRWLLYAGLYFVAADLIKSIKLKTKTLENLLILVGLMTALLGLIQYFFLPDTRFLEMYGWDPHYYRLIGTFLDPGFLGLILLLSLIIVVVKLWQQEKHRERLIAVGLVLYSSIALTYSRASYLAYSLVMGLMAWKWRSLRLIIFVLILGILTLYFLPRPGGEGVKLERESTIQARILNWQQTIRIAQDNLLFGVGFNAYRYVQGEYLVWPEGELKISHAGAGADSSLLFVLATTGILGLGAYLWIWLKALVLNLKSIKKPQNQIALLSLVAVLIHSFFNNSLFYPWIMAWLWLVLGGIKESKSP